jgi:glucose-6-phosphate 1-dehydrogenase
LGLTGLTGQEAGRWARVVVEKPFGHDLASSRKLDSALHQWLTEEQIYRIDHYLGKETVQNIFILRFANAIFEPIWNRRYIDHVQITVAETLGVENRAGYYEQSGALRDMFQNHMLEMLSLVAMEPPAAFEADRHRDEKVKLLRSIRPFPRTGLSDWLVRGQYAASASDGGLLPYRQEKSVRPDSQTETYVAMKVMVDNWRWQGVPFYLRSGKRLAKQVSEIAITFKPVPHSMFGAIASELLQPNVLTLKIQPEEGIALSIEAKRPGPRMCMSNLTMNFAYKDVFGERSGNAYERLLLDCMAGDQTLFVRHDGAELAWTVLEPILETWQNPAAELPLEFYASGSHGPQAADRLLGRDGRRWRPL